MSREPWNTGAAQPRGYAAKSPLTKGSRIILLQRERGSCAFPCFRRGRVWAEPRIRVKGRVPCGFLGQRPKPSESLQHTISTDFQGSFEPFYIGSVFHRSLDTTDLPPDLAHRQKKLLQPFSRKIGSLHRGYDFVRRSKRIDRQHSERRHTVDDGISVLLP